MKEIGLVTSCFDLLHAGHIMMLREAKTQCDYLIAALQTDPTIDRPEKKINQFKLWSNVMYNFLLLNMLMKLSVMQQKKI